MNVLIIKDNKPGHYNQSEGLLLQLRSVYNNVNVEYCEIEIKSKLSRKILRFLLNNFSSFFEKDKSLNYLKLFYNNVPLPKNVPNLIISTGGNTSNLNAWFSRFYKCKNILNGALRGLNENLFTYVTTVINLEYKNQIILDVAPSIIEQNKLKEASIKFIEENKLDINKSFYTLLIGGNGSGYSYDKAFYEKLVFTVKDLSFKNNIMWLISTSRRTPLEIESYLEKELKKYSAYFVSYNQKEEKILLPFLGLAEKIFVTEDSASMISEAITSCKPVFTLRPDEINSDKNYQKIIKKFQDAKFIYSLDVNKKIDIDKITFNNKEINNIFKEMEI